MSQYIRHARLSLTSFFAEDLTVTSNLIDSLITMETPKKNKTNPDRNTTPKSASKKNITNREYYDGHDAESENASVESLSSTDSYIEVEMPTPKTKEKKQGSTSEDDMADSFVTAKSSHADKEGDGKKKDESGVGDGRLVGSTEGSRVEKEGGERRS